jgi:hypothetical protein
MTFDWNEDNWVKQEYPNRFLRWYGTFMGKIAHWFLMRALPYQTTYSVPRTDDSHDYDWEKLRREYLKWREDNDV